MNRQCLKYSQYQPNHYQLSLKYSKYYFPLYKNANFCTRMHPRRPSLNHHINLITLNHQNIAKYEDYESQNGDFNYKEPIDPSISFESHLLNPKMMQINRGYRPNLRINKTSNARRSKSTNFRLVQRSQDQKKVKFSPSFCSTITLNSRESERTHKKITKFGTIQECSSPSLTNNDKTQKMTLSKLIDMKKLRRKNQSVQKIQSNLFRKKQIVGQKLKDLDTEMNVQPWCILQTQA